MNMITRADGNPSRTVLFHIGVALLLHAPVIVAFFTGLVSSSTAQWLHAIGGAAQAIGGVILRGMTDQPLR